MTPQEIEALKAERDALINTENLELLKLATLIAKSYIDKGWAKNSDTVADGAALTVLRMKQVIEGVPPHERIKS